MIQKRHLRTVGVMCLLFLPVGHAADNSAVPPQGMSSAAVKQLTNATARIRALEGVRARIRQGMSPEQALDRALEAALNERRDLERQLAARDAMTEDTRMAGTTTRSQPVIGSGTGAQGLPDLQVEWSGEERGSEVSVSTAIAAPPSRSLSNGAAVDASSSQDVLAFRAEDYESSDRSSRHHGEASTPSPDAAFETVSMGQGGRPAATRNAGPEYAVVFFEPTPERASRIADLMTAYDYKDATYLEGSRVTILETAENQDAARRLASSVYRKTGHEPIVRRASSVQSMVAAGNDTTTASGAGEGVATSEQAGESAKPASGRVTALADGLDARYTQTSASEHQESASGVSSPSTTGSVEREVFDVIYRVDDPGSLDALRSLLERSKVRDWFVARSGKAIYMGRFDTLERAVERQRRLKLKIGRLPTLEQERVREHRT